MRGDKRETRKSTSELSAGVTLSGDSRYIIRVCSLNKIGRLESSCATADEVNIGKRLGILRILQFECQTGYSLCSYWLLFFTIVFYMASIIRYFTCWSTKTNQNKKNNNKKPFNTRKITQKFPTLYFQAFTYILCFLQPTPLCMQIAFYFSRAFLRPCTCANVWLRC